MARSAPESFQRRPLTRVLGTDANVRLLRALALHGGQLSAPALAARTALSKGSVRTGLEAMLGLGVVAVRGSGHAQLYALRREHPLHPALEALFGAEWARYGAVLDAVRGAAEGCKPAPAGTYVYGSVARGEDGPGSDLDVIVVAEGEDDVAGLAGAMRDALQAPGDRLGFQASVIGLNLDDFRRAMGDEQSPWRAALQDALVVTGKNPAALARVREAKRHGSAA